MEIITEFTSNPLFIYIPVALALVGVVLVFTFGIKAPEQPPFDKLTAIDDRKPAGKKRKIKEKVSEQVCAHSGGKCVFQHVSTTILCLE